ncbi:MAG: hypothetical protein U0X39_12975 [Bacteroidales bacterium]
MGALRKLSYDAYADYMKLSGMLKSDELKIRDNETKMAGLEKNNEILSARNNDLATSVSKLETKAGILENDLRKTQSEKSEMAARIAKFEQSDQSRTDEFNKNIAGVNALRTSLETERQKLTESRMKEEQEAFERMKQTWRNHEEQVKKTLMNICQANLIDYVRDVPFKGKPDNTLMIAGEYVIFDAKSPAGDDLENFPKYIKLQTESVSKYIKQENVRKDVFLVIPSNTVSSINQYTYRLADYTVYIVTLDALEPVILSLKKLEDYEFAEQLTPEERENICRIIGKFSHTAKRKIMIDYFFSFQFLDIISKCNLDLPPDIQNAVVEFEKAEKLNPPQEKRTKQILMDELLRESEKLAIEAKARIQDDHQV